MAKSQVQFTKDNEYYTPKGFVDFFAQKLPVKRFEYDPATTEDKAKDLGIPNFYTKYKYWSESSTYLLFNISIRVIYIII